MTTLGSILSNSVWRAKNLITYTGEAQAPTLWSFNQYGYASPSNSRNISAQEKVWVDDYNYDRARMNAADQRALDSMMKDLLPLSEAVAISHTIGTTPDPLIKVIHYRYADPLILDLNGDGFEITPLSRMQ